MPIHVQAPDNSVIEFPDGTPDATISKVMSDSFKASTAPTKPEAPAPVAPVKQKSDQLLGLYEGSQRPIDNAATWLRQGLGTVIGDANSRAIDTKLNGLMGLPSSDAKKAFDEKIVADAAKQNVKPGTLGKIAGSMIGTAPVTAAMPGVIAPALAGGALASEAKDAKGVAGDALLGAVFGKGADIGLRGAGAIVAPKVNAMAKYLLDRGVKLTPGQIMGGFAHRAEDASRVLPVIGDMITGQQQEATKSFTKASIEEAMKPLGIKIPETAIAHKETAGHDMMGFAQQAIHDHYAAILPKLTVKIDSKLASDTGNLLGLAQHMPLAQRRQYNTLWNNEVRKRFGANGVMSGHTFQEVDEILNKEIKDFGTGNAGPHDRRYADAVRELQSQLRDAAERANPVMAKALQSTRGAFANLARLEPAAAAAKGGMFNANQLQTSVRGADTSVRKNATARGGARMQQMATAGQAKMSQSVPDSGTVTRGVINGLTAAALFGGHAAHISINPLAATTLAGLAGMYTGVGGKVARAALTRRPAIAAPIRAGLVAAARPASRAAAQAEVQSENARRSAPVHVTGY